MMKKLFKQAETSDLMNIIIKHPSIGKLKFNLFEELVISEAKINTELMEQPSVFAYLGLLHKKLERIVKDRQMNYDKVFGTVYLKYKEETNHSTGRVYDKETVIQKANTSLSCTKAMEELNKAMEERDIISVCLKSFEQRANMIQTLSANIRKIS